MAKSEHARSVNITFAPLSSTRRAGIVAGDRRFLPSVYERVYIHRGAGH